ncbi:UDP-glucose 4-epimerase GalE [Clostridium tertium]|jgi:UDP-glucose 4-epimerase|uniref:UDP-glucose 4-epimerase GalE n=1 Tax=Clostridium TaxID=1485 RepID=UPI001157253A|nr:MULTISPECIES: UDP-glucose 4-epimerase GalE [Clostridium]MBU6134383.1 UDP-glucose 4-epimerase GalE [Clostridium tertium]MDB1934348.1 UDP-glucose 4-epimerase GalE [Clostridium tertium]MDB1935849.1 UDP-glucose 4-epimerase GalE [Clostridium tertium]MDB1953675.1 UDP-glucose 4-epimerase GalE [Clostridium tertium]MDB1957765.1 UDP-glucose 4-epimerase GalE [Clostridium tertium]
MAILITGGLGYIGSHTAIELLNNGYEIVIADNLYNSKLDVLDKIKKITNKIPKFYKIDLLDEQAVESIFKENDIEAIIHFAAFKAVGESCTMPIEYYHNNITSTLVVLKAMKKYKVKKFVFSSSATVYGDAKSMPIKEDFPLSVTNPYGRTKLMIEDILRDTYKADSSWGITILRYFNPIGAHESGEIGENPNGIPNNLMPYITKVAAGELKELEIFGDDYKTKDGTGVRDFIHVVDIARGHIKALESLKNKSGIFTYNLGTGNGYSVLEIVKTFEKVNNIQIPYRIVDRREGDIAICYADSSKSNRELGWVAEKSLEEMCKDSWRWQINNSSG